jgi:hypothetical protein
MVNSKELIGATEAVTLETKCLIKRCRYKRSRLGSRLHGRGNLASQVRTRSDDRTDRVLGKCLRLRSCVYHRCTKGFV